MSINVAQEIESAINRIIEEGKEPTTALIKSQLRTTVPIPILITALKTWKSSKYVPKIEQQNPTNSTEEQRIASLEKQVSSLIVRIRHLETIIERGNQ